MTVTPNNNHPDSVTTSERTDGVEVREPVKAPIEADDPDAIDIAEAQAAIEREQAAAKAAGQGEQTGEPQAAPQGEPQAPQPPAQPQGQPQQQGPKAEPPMIPKPRFDEVLGKADELARRNAFLEGQIAAMQSQKPAGQAQGQPAAEPEKPKRTLEQIDADKVALAEEYDSGKLSTAEWKKREVELDREARQLMQQPAQASQQPPAGSDDLFLEQLTQQLEAKHPYSTLITDEADWAFIETKARQQLAAEGEKIGDDSRSTFLLRQKMAQLTDKYGPTLTGKQLQQPQVQRQGGQQQQQPGGSTKAQAREAKLQQADGMPPNINSLGGTAASSTEISEADILAMDDEAIAALPESTRRRFLQT